MTWYILREGTKEGPYSDERLGELIETGHLKPDALVWKPGLVKWTLIGDIPGLLVPPSTTTESLDPPLHETESSAQETSHFQTSDQVKPALVHPEPSTLADRPLGKTRRGSYIFRHWRGELSLSVSYWVNGFILTAAIVIVMTIIPWDNFVSKSPKLYSTAIIALWILVAITTIWQLVGIWRSADNYLHQRKSKLWGNLAKIAVVLGLIRAIADFASVGIPQVKEFAKIATGDDPLGTYQLRVLRDATEIEIAGAIVFGLTDDVRRTLDAHPTVHIIHLNSNGGRVSEARNLRDLIASRGLTTFTASGCFSACTLAYAAGQKRLIARDGILGFHQYSFPGVKEQAFQSEYEKDKQDWLARGFVRTFVDRAFATPNNDMWRPTHRELFAGGVVTGYPESNDVAVTGFELKDLENIEAEFAKNPLFSTLQMYEPAIYDRLMSEIRTGLQQGRSQAELREKILPLVQSVYMQRLPYGSDSALRSFTGLMLEQMNVLYSVDPAICYDYVYGKGRDAKLNVTKYFSKELQQKEFSIMAEVIRSAAGQTSRPNEKQIERQLTTVFASIAQRYGDDAQMLTDPKIGRTNKAKTCELTYELYQTILRLPERESGALLRFMFASVK